MKNFTIKSVLTWMLLSACLLCPFRALAEIDYTGLVGDVNGDKAIDINDVTSLIDYILSGENLPAGIPDVTLDESIDINDVTQLIEMLLKGERNLTFLAKGVLFKMIYVEGGTFTMGTNLSSAMFTDKPAHRVTLSSYYIAETELTQKLWYVVMNKNSISTYKGDNLPVQRETWNKCQTMITTLNELLGFNFRMPTDAEWEYAGRGGIYNHNYTYAGSSSIDEVAWWADNNSPVGPKEVATKAPNELGLYDMTGNVKEWVSDWYADYTSAAQTNPTGPETGNYKVVRGGAYSDFDTNCYIYHRTSTQPNPAVGYVATQIGMRLALTLE